MASGISEILYPSDPSRGVGRGTLRALPIHPGEIHKSRADNVWVHDPIEETPHSLSTGFTVPARHVALRFVELIEVQRQIGILQAHRQFGVPEGDVFTLDQIALKLVTPTSPMQVARDRGVVRAQIVATASRGRARSLSQYFTFEGPSGLVAVGQARASLIPRAVYARVRERSRVPSASLAALGLRASFHYEETLHIDTADPLLSDHPSDHLTAIQTIADIERVAVERYPHASLQTLRLTFQRYADAEPNTLLRLDVSAKGRLVAEVVQQGVRRAKVTGSLTSMDDPR